MPEAITTRPDTNLPSEQLPCLDEIHRTILRALRAGPLHYTALRRALHARWVKLPKYCLDDVLDDLLQQSRIEIICNGQSVTYRLRSRKA